MTKSTVLCSSVLLLLLVGGIVVGCGGSRTGTAEWYFEQGNKVADQGNYDEAIKNYDEDIRLNSQYAKAYANRARAGTMLGMDKEAQQDVERAVGLGFDRSVLETEIDRLKKLR